MATTYVNYVRNPQPTRWFNAAAAAERDWTASATSTGSISAGDPNSFGRPSVRSTRITTGAWALYGGGRTTGVFAIPGEEAVAGSEWTLMFRLKRSAAGTGVITSALGYGTASAALAAVNHSEGVGEEVQVRDFFTIPSGQAGQSFFPKIGTASGTAGTYYEISDVAIVKGHYTGPYFDGDTQDGLGWKYDWLGDPNLSRSTRASFMARPTTQPATTRKRGWRYFAQRLNGDGTETMLHPNLPLEGVEISDVVSGFNSISGTLEPEFATLKDAAGEPLLREWSTALYAENDGRIYGGILVDSTFEGARWSLDSIGFAGYCQGMPFVGGPIPDPPPGWSQGTDGSGYGVYVDPIDVVRVIWSHLQSQIGGNIGLTLASTKSGTTIGTELRQVEFDSQEGPVSFEAGPYKLAWHKDDDLSKNMNDLAAQTPFDYHEEHTWDGDNIRHFLNIGYPSLGRRRDDLRFVFGENIFEAPSLERSGEEYASGVLVLGAGEGSATVNMPLILPPSGGLRRIAVVVDKSLNTQGAAFSRAIKETSARRERSDTISEVVVIDHKHAPLGSVQPGDEIHLEGRLGWKTIDLWARVMEISISPADGGQAVYTVVRSDKLT